MLHIETEQEDSYCLMHRNFVIPGGTPWLEVRGHRQIHPSPHPYRTPQKLAPAIASFWNNELASVFCRDEKWNLSKVNCGYYYYCYYYCYYYYILWQVSFLLVLLSLNQCCTPPLRHQISDCSTYLMSYVLCPSYNCFCRESIECFPGTVYRFFSLFVTIPVAPVLPGMMNHFLFHIHWLSTLRCSFFNLFLLLLPPLPPQPPPSSFLEVVSN